MSHLNNGERAFVVDQQEFAYKIRPFLGLSDSAVVQADDGRYLGYAGDQAKTDLVNTTTQSDGNGNIISEIPTDFRLCGVTELTQRGISMTIQAKMLTNFMKDFTKEQRATFVAQYDAVKNDPDQVTLFVNAMLAMLHY